MGCNAFEMLVSVKELIDCGINLYIQKEQLTLLDEEGHPSLFAPIMIATLSTCAQLERDNISFRLQSERKRYIEKGGKLGRRSVLTKSAITAIKLLILRSFQRKGLCNSGLKAKSTTFVRNITTIRLRSQFVILKMNINMTDITEKTENGELVTNRDQLVVMDNIESLIKVIRGQQRYEREFDQLRNEMMNTIILNKY